VKGTSLNSYQFQPGSYSGVGAAVLPAFYSKYFAFGVLAQSQLGAIQNSDGSVRYRSLYQLIPTAGTGVSLANGILRLGYSLQWVNQASGDITVPSGTVPPGYNQGLAQGSAFSNTVGATLTMPWPFLPAASVVARNIGGEHFSSTSLYHFTPNPTGPPPNQLMSLDSSFSIAPKLGPGTTLNLVAEYRDMTDTSGIETLGRLAFGAEIAIRNSFFLRGGFGSGYPSAGIGIRQSHGEFDLTWYSEELGTSYHSDRDDRFMLQYVIRAF
jgi:hypothetical protein